MIRKSLFIALSVSVATAAQALDIKREQLAQLSAQALLEKPATLTCWQAGKKIIEETGVSLQSLPQDKKHLTLTLHKDKNTALMLLQLKETTCLLSEKSHRNHSGE